MQECFSPQVTPEGLDMLSRDLVGRWRARCKQLCADVGKELGKGASLEPYLASASSCALETHSRPQVAPGLDGSPKMSALCLTDSPLASDLRGNRCCRRSYPSLFVPC